MATTREDRAAKRELLVTAAADVLRTEGVAGCTVRSIAARAGLSKSTIHYYLEDIDELVDMAFTRLMDQFVELMERTAASATNPFDAVWAAAEVYVRMGRSRDRRIPLMTFEVLVTASRTNRLHTVRPVMDNIGAVFRRLLGSTGIDHSRQTADVLLATLIGIIVRAEIQNVPLDKAFRELAEVIHVPPPSAAVGRLLRRAPPTRPTPQPITA